MKTACLKLMHFSGMKFALSRLNNRCKSLKSMKNFNKKKKQ